MTESFKYSWREQLANAWEGVFFPRRRQIRQMIENDIMRGSFGTFEYFVEEFRRRADMPVSLFMYSGKEWVQVDVPIGENRKMRIDLQRIEAGTPPIKRSIGLWEVDREGNPTKRMMLEYNHVSGRMVERRRTDVYKTTIGDPEGLGIGTSPRHLAIAIEKALKHVNHFDWSYV